MRNVVIVLCAVAAASSSYCVAQSNAAQPGDIILKAMRDEMQRSKSIGIATLDKPYFVEYMVEDADMVSINATLGALLSATHTPFRAQSVRVRVGDYSFDNANYVYSDAYGGMRYDTEQMPIDANYLGLRHILWLATDRAYKTAEDAIARKRSALKNVSVTESLPDFARAAAVQGILPLLRKPLDEQAWKTRIVRVSAALAGFPEIMLSGVEFQSAQSATYVVNSEGTAVRAPDDVAFVRLRASGQAADGMPVHDAEVLQAANVDGLPSEAEMMRQATVLGDTVTALVKASRGEAYDGPVLFEARAAAQLFGQLLGDNLKLSRKPVSEPGRPVPYLPSELEARVGSRILPDWMDVVDDPTLAEYNGQKMFGSYVYDLEGVSPKPLALIEKGVLKTFLLTRTPALKGFEVSNGHARMPGNFGAKGAGFGNLFVRASEKAPFSDMKKKLLDLCKQRNKPYGILIRKLDWPSSASYQELRRDLQSMAQSGGGSRPVSVPLLVYRVYQDGREELVRGLRFRGLSTRSLRDIVAAGDQPYVYNFMDTPAPFALMGGAGFVANASVIAPAVLFDEIELETVKDEMPQPPIVPPPPLKHT